MLRGDQKTIDNNTSNIPSNILQYIDSFDLTDSTFSSNVLTNQAEIRVTLVWKHPERWGGAGQPPNREAQTRLLERRPRLRLARGIPRNDFLNMATAPGGGETARIRCPLSGDQELAFFEGGGAEIRGQRTDGCGDYDCPTEMESHSGDESTVSVSSLDSAAGAQRATRESAIPEKSDRSDAAVVEETSGDKIDQVMRSLSPIQEAITSNAETEYSSDTTYENAYDVAPRDPPDFVDDVTPPAKVTSRADVTAGSPSNERRVSTGFVMLKPKKTEKEDLPSSITVAKRCSDILNSGRSSVMSQSQGGEFTFDRANEKQLVELYENHMDRLVVVRASKFRMSQGKLQEALFKSGTIDLCDVTDVFYDEVVMTRPAYVIQFKAGREETVAKLTSTDTAGGYRSLNPGDNKEDDVKMSRPQVKMMEVKWRKQFVFQ